MHQKLHIRTLALLLGAALAWAPGSLGLGQSDGEEATQPTAKGAYIDKTGKVIASGDWDRGYAFDENGLALVYRDSRPQDRDDLGRYGFVALDGSQSIGMDWTDASFFSQGLACVQKDGKYGYINTQGDVVIAPQWDYAEPFTEGGTALVFNSEANPNMLEGEDEKRIGKYGLIDMEGNLLEGGLQWDVMESFIGPHTVVAKDGLYGFLNQDGTLLAEPQWDYADYFDDTGFALVYLGEVDEGWPQEGAYGYMNSQGELLGGRYWEAAHRFVNGLACVMEDDLWGYIDQEGQLAIAPQFLEADDFTQDGLARVFFLQPIQGEAEEMKWLTYGHIDREGNPVGRTDWENVGEFSNGYAWVKENSKCGYVSTQGHVVWEPQWDWAGDFNANGIAMVGNGLTDLYPQNPEARFGFVTADGQRLGGVEWTDAYGFYGDELLTSVAKDGKYGFMDRSGQLVIPLQWDYAGSFNNYGVAQVLDAASSPPVGRLIKIDAGFITPDGALVGGQMWEDAQDAYEDGLLCIKDGGLYGFMNVEGQWTVEPQFLEPAYFDNGYAFVRLEE